MHRVVVTGVGVVSPNGIGRRDFGEAILEGRSGVSYDRELRHVGSADQDRGRGQELRRAALSGRAQEERQADEPGGPICGGRGGDGGRGRGPRPGEARPGAVRRLHGDGDHARRRRRARRSDRCGASGDDGSFDMAEFAQARSESIFPLWLLQHLPNMAAAHISILHHAMGPNNTIVTACAAGTQAVGEAFRLIGRGDADVMLAGGCDSRLDPQFLVAYRR